MPQRTLQSGRRLYPLHVNVFSTVPAQAGTFEHCPQQSQLKAAVLVLGTISHFNELMNLTLNELRSRTLTLSGRLGLLPLNFPSLQKDGCSEVEQGALMTMASNENETLPVCEADVIERILQGDDIRKYPAVLPHHPPPVLKPQDRPHHRLETAFFHPHRSGCGLSQFQCRASAQHPEQPFKLETAPSQQFWAQFVQRKICTPCLCRRTQSARAC